MSHFASVIDELEVALRSGSPGKRTEVLRQITSLFASGAENLSEQQISLFDDVMGHLVRHVETEARAELSAKLAPVANAPVGVIQRLASDDAISVAGPILANSDQLTDDDLIAIAKTKSQEHQLKIAGRTRLNEAVTEVLIDRCDSEVVNEVAGNKGARFSKTSFSKLVMLADGDNRLTTTIAGRSDIPPRLFRQLLAHATETVRESLLASAQPEAREGLKKILAGISCHIDRRMTSERYAAAQKLVESFSQDTDLGRTNLARFAYTGKIQELVATFSMLTAVPVDLVDRVIYDDSPFGIIVLCKVLALDWDVAQAIILNRPQQESSLALDIEDLFADYEKLSPPSAQKILRFWQTKQEASTATRPTARPTLRPTLRPAPLPV